MEEIKQKTIAELEKLYDRAVAKGQEELADLILVITADKQAELALDGG